MSLMDCHNKGPGILAVIWSLTGVTTIFVAIRIYIRFFMIRNAGTDDYIMLGSLFLTLSNAGMTTANVRMGYGKHQKYLEESTVERIILINTISFAVGIASFTVPKFAVTSLLTRILIPSRAQRIWLWSLLGITAAVSLTCIFVLFNQCDPPRAAWERRLAREGQAKCHDMWILIKIAILNAVLSAFVDFYLAIYPSTVLMKLHMPLGKRLALCAALGMGTVAAAMAIVKSTEFPDMASQDDFTYDTAELVMWTIVESNVIILASCIPTLQPILDLTLRGAPFRTRGPQGKETNYNSAFHFTGVKTNRRSDRSATHLESQESILDEHQKNSHPLGAIIRTDDVSVEYNSRSTQNLPDRHTTWHIG
ncbi:hypothetical protein BDV28DRAFT_155050 [Aspergillus coremiiformis]|uniref:Rhodopsin domain-containing protein n=1 Tax=Aspergillus coremiiformis TaxID=138285 RepID=A0A5N6ZG79_9EURO|nr:hypothetical protein BDV28DRAFT_155050 [Aspergillus coremiiformis]